MAYVKHNYTENKRTMGDETYPKLDEEPAAVRHGTGPAVLRHIGATRIGVWVIKHVVSPLDRLIYQRTGGRGVFTGKPLGPLLLLTTTGRRSGADRTTPVFYLRDGERLVLCNVNPGFERPNPWTLNLRANPVARVQIGPVSGIYQAHEASKAEVDRYWPQLVQIWPAYQTFYERSGQRLVFARCHIGIMTCSSASLCLRAPSPQRSS
jgi:F420H(2)-dependent quinone reductase